MEDTVDVSSISDQKDIPEVADSSFNQNMLDLSEIVKGVLANYDNQCLAKLHP